MSEHADFFQLASNLSEKERKNLYERVKRSLSLEMDKSSEQTIYQVKKNKGELDKLIQYDMEKAGLKFRIKYWLRRLFSRRSNREVFLKLKKDTIQKKINNSYSEVTNLYTRKFLPGFPEAVFELYKKALPVRGMFELLWEGDSSFIRMINLLLEEKIPEAKTELVHFITVDEMEEIFLKSENKTTIKIETLKRMKKYLNQIPKDIFNHLNEGILPLYYLKNLVLFPFEELFGYFKYFPKPPLEEKRPVFSEASAGPVMEFLEKIYVALYTVNRLQKSFHIHPELLKFYLIIQKAEKEKNSKVDDKPVSQGTADEEINQLRSSLYKIHQEAVSFQKKVPVADLIRLYFDDPYYKCMVYLPKINLHDFYKSALQMKLEWDIDNYYNEIRNGVIDKMLKRIFPKMKMIDFTFYKGTVPTIITSLGLPSFRFVRSLNLVYNFLLLIYKAKIQELVRVLNQVAPARFRDDVSRMLLHAAGLEDLTDKIQEFDTSFSPQSEEGKNFYRLRYSIETEVSHQRTYRAIVSKTNKDARALIETGIEHINGFISVFNVFKKASESGLGERFATYRITAAEPDVNALERVLTVHLDKMDLTKKAINHVLVIEEGR
jgi:hypothetical protein